MHANKTLLATAAASFATLMLAVGPAAAEEPFSISANIGVVSNYMFRGTTQTGDQPAVQGGLDFTHESGFYAGTWASNVDFDEGSSESVFGTVAVDPTTASGFAEDEDGNLIVTGESSGADAASPNYEIDFYLGFGGDINDDLSWDVNGIYYAYPDGRDSDYAEIGGSMTWKWFSLGLAYTVYGENDGGLYDNGDIYYYGGFEYGDLPFGLSFSARAGYTDFRHDDNVIDPEVDPTLTYESSDYWHYGASISKDAGDFGTFSFNWDQNNGKTDSEFGFDNDPKFWVGWNKEF
jgi:uncharacterized protein (TIGR02001 family)